MNLLNLRSMLRRRVGNPTEADRSNSQLDEFINLALQDIADMFPFHATRERIRFSTIVGTNIYALPSVYTGIYAIWNRTKRREIRRRDYINTFPVDTIGTNLPSPGSIETYSRVQNSVQFFPMPGEIEELEIFATKSPATLAADADVPTIPSAWHLGVVLRARWHYWDDMGDFAKAQYAMSTFNAWAATKTNEFQEELAAFERSVQVPVLGRWRGKYSRMLAPDEWRTGEM